MLPLFLNVFCSLLQAFDPWSDRYLQYFCGVEHFQKMSTNTNMTSKYPEKYLPKWSPKPAQITQKTRPKKQPEQSPKFSRKMKPNGSLKSKNFQEKNEVPPGPALRSPKWRPRDSPPGAQMDPQDPPRRGKRRPNWPQGPQMKDKMRAGWSHNGAQNRYRCFKPIFPPKVDPRGHQTEQNQPHRTKTALKWLPLFEAYLPLAQSVYIAAGNWDQAKTPSENR